ncbi:unnamed protein product, partial [Rotaria socialis]
MARMNTSLLMHFLKSSRFTGVTGNMNKNKAATFVKGIFSCILGEEVFFDENGDGPG